MNNFWVIGFLPGTAFVASGITWLLTASHEERKREILRAENAVLRAERLRAERRLEEIKEANHGWVRGCAQASVELHRIEAEIAKIRHSISAVLAAPASSEAA